MTLLPLAQTLSLLPLPVSLIPTACPAPWVDAAPPHLRLAHPPARAPPLRPAQASDAPPPRPDRRAHGAANLSARLPLTSCCGSDGDAIRRCGTLPTAKRLCGVRSRTLRRGTSCCFRRCEDIGTPTTPTPLGRRQQQGACCVHVPTPKSAVSCPRTVSYILHDARFLIQYSGCSGTLFFNADRHDRIHRNIECQGDRRHQPGHQGYVKQ